MLKSFVKIRAESVGADQLLSFNRMVLFDVFLECYVI